MDGAVVEQNGGPRYIPLAEFAKMAQKSEYTIKKRREEIPGIKKNGDDWMVLEGTRFPLKINSCTIEDDSDRRRILLFAISKYQYIDAKMLGVWQETFEGYLRDLLNAELIRKTNVPNHYGANAYDCTAKGSEIAKEQRDCSRQKLINAISECTGTFTGAVYSQVINV